MTEPKKPANKTKRPAGNTQRPKRKRPAEHAAPTGARARRTAPKAASPMVAKLLKSAMANAENNHNMNKDDLYVSECFVCPGPIMKRVMPRAQGRAFRILKRTSHITLVVKEKE